jgi:hypothetical protein
MRTPSRTSKSARPAALEVEVLSVAPAAPPTPAMPWWLAAAGGVLLDGLAGWAIVAALVVWGELSAQGALTKASFTVATQFWCLAHGGPLVRDGVTVTLIPLGLTVLLGSLLYSVTAYAARQARLAQPDAPARSAALKVAATGAAAYGLAVTAVAVAVNPDTPPWAGLGAFGLAFLVGGFAAAGAAGWRPQRAWPGWLQALPQAVATAVAILLLGGLAATVTGLVMHRQLVGAIFDQLDPGLSGTVLLALLQLAFLGNVVIWAAAWTTGAGFSLGGDSVVALVGHQVDALPTVPLIGALPTASPAPWYVVFWIAVGVAAGGVAAWTVVRARPRARFDATALVGGAAGILSGLVFTAGALLSRGDLGADRLAGMGPQPLETLILATTVLGFSGLATGLVLGLLQPPSKAPAVSVEQVARTAAGWAAADTPPAGAADAVEAAGVAAAAPAPEPEPAPAAEPEPEPAPAPEPEPVVPVRPAPPRPAKLTRRAARSAWPAPAPAAADAAAAAEPAAPPKQRKIRVHFGPHNVAAPSEPPEVLTDALADQGPLEEDSGRLDLTQPMTAPFHRLTGGRRAEPGNQDPLV